MGANLVLRALLAFGAAGLAAVAAGHLLTLEETRDELVESAVELEVAAPELVVTLRRAEDPAAARTALARALLAAALDGEQAPEDPTELRGQRLAEAEDLARGVLEARPAAWEAATIAGAATYLRWSLDRDPRLLQQYRSWEEPLLLARRIAPGQRQPGRYLATAYLELWPALSDAKRRLVRELLADAFQDRATFSMLLGPWLAASGGDLGPVPDTPWAWQAVAEVLADRRDWEAYCRAWETHRRALRAGLTSQVQEALRLLEANKLLVARGALLGVAAAAPVDRDFAGVVDRALRAAPHGPARRDLTPALARWLVWAADLALRGDPPLSAPTLGRLRAAVAAGAGDDRAARAAVAWSYLAAGDLAGAQRTEQTSPAIWSEAWGPYWIEKAGWLAERGEADAARAALAEVHAEWRNHPAYSQARLSVAEAAGDAVEARKARTALAARSAAVWGPFDWSWREGLMRLEPLVTADARDLSLYVTISDVPATGAAAAVRWNGRVLGCYPVPPSGELRLAPEITRGLHLLEVETLASPGGRLAPGTVALVADVRTAAAAPATTASARALAGMVRPKSPSS